MEREQAEFFEDFYRFREHVTDSLKSLHEELTALADALADAFAQLQATVTDLQTQETAAATELGTLAAQVAAIQPGTTLTADDVTALTSNVQSVADALKTATDAAANPAPAPAPAPVVAPADGETPAQAAVDQATQQS